MPSLLDLQRAFKTAVTAYSPEEDAPPRLESYLSGRIEIYGQAYKARLTEALKANFPTLHRVLGDDAFRELAHRFIDESPSEYRSIRWFGRELEMLALRDGALLPHSALLDLLKMDWALGIAFDAADVPAATESDLQRVAPTNWAALTFAFHPSLSLLKLDWAVEPLWRAVMKDENAETPEPIADAHYLLVWRREFEAKWRIVDEHEALALNQLGIGMSFGDLCESMAADDNETKAVVTAAQYLKGWIIDRVLVQTAATAAAKPECTT